MYYLLYTDDYEMESKVAIDPEEPSLGRIRADSVTPPHCPTSIKRCISRVERNPALANANLFADGSCDTPLEECHISILRTDGPGLSQNEPMAVVQVESPGSRDTPLEEGHASILCTDGIGPSQNEPMAVVQVESPGSRDTPLE